MRSMMPASKPGPLDMIAVELVVVFCTKYAAAVASSKRFRRKPSGFVETFARNVLM